MLDSTLVAQDHVEELYLIKRANQLEQGKLFSRKTTGVSNYHLAENTIRLKSDFPSISLHSLILPSLFINSTTIKTVHYSSLVFSGFFKINPGPAPENRSLLTLPEKRFKTTKDATAIGYQNRTENMRLAFLGPFYQLPPRQHSLLPPHAKTPTPTHRRTAMEGNEEEDLTMKKEGGDRKTSRIQKLYARLVNPLHSLFPKKTPLTPLLLVSVLIKQVDERITPTNRLLK